MKQRGVVPLHFIPLFVHFAYLISGASSPVIFVTDNFLSCFRVYGSSYHAFDPLKHWDVGDLELSYLYHCNLSSIPVDLTYAHFCNALLSVVRLGR
jgi:hypothetical protein